MKQPIHLIIEISLAWRPTWAASTNDTATGHNWWTYVSGSLFIFRCITHDIVYKKWKHNSLLIPGSSFRIYPWMGWDSSWMAGIKDMWAPGCSSEKVLHGYSVAVDIEDSVGPISTSLQLEKLYIVKHKSSLLRKLNFPGFSVQCPTNPTRIINVVSFFQLKLAILAWQPDSAHL